jgi:predicted TIM-barrel enzyme/DNA-binding NtrC family response regulator
MDTEASPSGSNTVQKLKATLRTPNATIVGAAIGTGMAAQAASRGGADFLLALNAGRIRSMGAPSMVSLLALRPSNEFVMEFARSEILPRASAPVFFGACAFDPREQMERVVDSIIEAGFDGLANFPTAVFLDGSFRAAIEKAGVGFERELALLATARRRGLATLAYVHTLSEAERAAAIGVDVINLSLGWYVEGKAGSRADLSFERASEYAKQVFRKIRIVHSGAICLLEGGPIVRPEEMYRVCRASKADGYIGGSTIDRVLPEYSIEHMTSAFKTVGVLQKRIDELERELEFRQGGISIVGRSASIRQATKILGRLAESNLPVLITGERGTGKKLFARAIHEAAAHTKSKLVIPREIAESGVHLLGKAAAAPNDKRVAGLFEAYPSSTILIENFTSLSNDAQARLAETLEFGLYRRLGDDEPGRFAGRLIFTETESLAALTSGKALHEQFAERLAPGNLALPPLRERLEDLPLLAEYFLRKLSEDEARAAISIDYSAFRELLSREWPGNVRQLRTVIETAALRSESGRLLAEHLPPAAAVEPPEASPVHGERSWILDALQRHRFRRGETARFLGISRKTLYNKMRLFGLSVGP